MAVPNVDPKLALAPRRAAELLSCSCHGNLEIWERVSCVRDNGVTFRTPVHRLQVSSSYLRRLVVPKESFEREIADGFRFLVD